MPRAKKPKPPVESPRLPKSYDREQLAHPKKAYTRPNGLGKWTEESVDTATDAQIRGKFKQPVRLAKSLLKEPSIFAASVNRLAPHRGLRRRVKAPTGVELKGSSASILDEAQATFGVPTSVALSAGVLADDFDRLSLHAYSVNQLYWLPRADGSRLDAFVEAWPLEFVEYFEVPPDGCDEPGCYALTTEGYVRIIHGNGRWMVTALHADQPWRHGALVALAGLWVDMRFGRRDRSRNAESHGDDKWFAILPPSIMPSDPNGLDVQNELAAMYDPRHAAVFPNSTTVTRSEAMSQNWQIFKELLGSGFVDASRILLGQDGTMTNTGGNYIKAWGMFGVRNDIIEGDFSAENAAITTGLLRPWSLINFGRWDKLEHEWIMPDADEDARRESIAERTDAFNKAWKEYRDNGAEITQPFLDKLAAEYGVTAPTLATAPATAPAAPAPAPASSGETIPTVTPYRAPLRPVG